MTTQFTFARISEALAARAQLRQRRGETRSAIFRLKRDERISDDAFDERRVELNEEARLLEDQIAVIDAWIEERRNEEKIAEAREKARIAAEAYERETERQVKLEEIRKRAKIEEARIALERERERNARIESNDREFAAKAAATIRIAVKAMISRNPEHITIALDTMRSVLPDLVRPAERVDTRDEREGSSHET